MKQSSFVTYIDESGDEGFVFREDGSGSSRWFVMSAVIIRKQHDLQMVECLKEARAVLGKPPKTTLHFVDLKHEQRVPFVRRIGALPIRTVTVFVYKPMIREPEKFQNTKYLLYHYVTRFLLERVSWFCRDHRRDCEGDGFTDIIFSNRSNMSYEDIKEYLRRILCRSEAYSMNVQVDPTVIDPDRIQAIEHSIRAGLQVADGVASGLHFAVKVSKYGEAEPAYAGHLKKTLYRHSGNVMGYGLKLWPCDLSDTKAKAPEAGNLEGL